jgi:hypothetical protein
MKPNDLLLLVLAAILIGGAFWMTYRNSPKHAYILLGVVALSFIIGQIKSIQMFSLLGIVGVLVLMVMSRGVREKAVQTWLQENHFVFVKNENGPEKFQDSSLNGSSRFFCYNNKVTADNQAIPFVYTIRFNTAQVANRSSVTVHCSYYFREGIDVNALEKQLLKAKENTAKSHLVDSHFGYFDMKDCEIFRTTQGGVCIGWRTPDTPEGYNERYEWIKQALNANGE